MCHVGYDGTQFQLLRGIVPANTVTFPSNPATTVSTTGVMMGLAGSITPRVSGTIKVWVAGDITNGVSTELFYTQIRYGTGAAPANGAALTGTTLGGLVRGKGYCPFCLVGEVTGLTVATAYWVDVSATSEAGGTVQLQNISILLEEAGR
jgi:hypothetical protein